MKYTGSLKEAIVQTNETPIGNTGARFESFCLTLSKLNYVGLG